MKPAGMEEEFPRLQFSPTVCDIYKVRKVKDNVFVGSKSPFTPELNNFKNIYR